MSESLEPRIVGERTVRLGIGAALIPCAQCAYDKEYGGITVHYHPAAKAERWAEQCRVKSDHGTTSHPGGGAHTCEPPPDHRAMHECGCRARFVAANV